MCQLSRSLRLLDALLVQEGGGEEEEQVGEDSVLVSQVVEEEVITMLCGQHCRAEKTGHYRGIHSASAHRASEM